ncbi:MAG TPA: hypothetical protein VHU19_01555 [Pyrinomonadaceae bacterium]|jgi:hypothetical protein|nr:hypothetical protein [Pyrinomonadaceae bacterium]
MIENHTTLARRYSTILIATFCLLLAMTPAEAQNKIITANPTPNANPPVTIKQITLSGKAVELGAPLAASDDWLDDLSITVENSSGKSVVYLDLVLSFAHINEGGPSLVLPLSFGQVSGAPNAVGKTEILAPGASTTITIGKRANSLKQALSDHQHQSDKLNVYITTALFEDGIIWRNSSEGHPDPSHPLRWNIKGAGGNLHAER